MRHGFLFLLLALSASVAASAQPEGDPIPDPTPPEQYYPLAVGNEWEYANQGLLPLTEGYFLRREIVRDTLIEGRTYFVEVRTRNDDDGMGWHSPRTRIVRFDSTSARPVEWGGTQEGPFECSFRSDFGAAIVCWGDESLPDGDTYVSGQVEAVIPFGGGGEGLPPPGEVEVLAVKRFFTLGIADYGMNAYYAAPIGYAGETPGYCTGCRRNLTYARVRLDDGSLYEVGARYAVASEDTPEAGGLTLAVGPNPTAGPLTLRLGGAVAEVTLEAFDALGRRVWTQDRAGRQPVEVDASGWAPGLYVVRARTDTEVVTTTVVRR